MSFAKVYSAQTHYLKAHIVDIEVDLSNGMHSFSIVGLGDKAVDESKDRIAAAIKNSGFKSPKVKNQKVIISLAPADIRKEGPLFDLGMAIGYLLAAGEIDFQPEKKIFLGELSLDGKLRKIQGILPLVKQAKEQGFTEVFLPLENAREAALVEGIAIYGAKDMSSIISHIDEKNNVHNSTEELSQKLTLQPKTVVSHTINNTGIDFKDIKGQEIAKRGLQIAAAGGHNALMFGPPGTGKTMLAKAFNHILPSLSFDEVIEVTSIHSVAGILQDDLIVTPPFRAPHHTSSYSALIGGGANPKPGEITLAHKGVLFLDEFPEFDRRVIDALRQPLEDKVITITRANGRARFPAHFILIAAMNPCPCGNFGIENKECICSPNNVAHYQQKISGPIMDRIDIWLEVSEVNYKDLLENTHYKESSAQIKSRVEKATHIQLERFKHASLRNNSEMNTKDIAHFVSLSEEVKKILTTGAQKLQLSARSYYRIIKLARTIADLESSPEIKAEHMLEALQYRPRQTQR